MLRPFIEIFKHRRIIFNTTLRELQSRNAGSILGVFWLVIYPVLFLAMYAFIYLMVFKIRLAIMSPYEYVMLIFCGLIPFLSFAESLSRGVGAVTSNSSLIKNTLFPIELIPVNVVLSSKVILLVGFLMLLGVMIYFHKVGYYYFYLPLVILLQILFTIGVTWIISALNVFFRDLGQIISLVVLMLMMISPIAYTEDMIPQELKSVLYVNPLYYLIVLYQKIFMFNSIDYKLLGIFAAIALVTFIIGYYFFIKLKGVFSDYI
ncbi:Wzm family protein [Taylorella equigenitalis 14/56]|uniref:Transport permease protein n=3 Tax=Taylorella equigenitalis TaxID=29575 RepID=A0A654KHS9_TAYEM|nr:ABC transporter permease [Taylorella equigenitalis]ADU91935.1 O-antigen export system permease protein RfbD [Taylorella equigenitalis MCE9]AFN35498.1 Wzm family protein [Taylorella equigenitalis ATCC 35865]ASY30150.1 ABC transporter [Taylorella equigenitalis]ASY38926.1 ABC transporter [Taylorella equigenitalis]ASY41880.1 ABC transporter [Taylorella equigenitalis]